MKVFLLIINDLADNAQTVDPSVYSSIPKTDVIFLRTLYADHKKTDENKECGFSAFFNTAYLHYRNTYKYVGFVDAGVEIEWGQVHNCLDDLVTHMQKMQYSVGACKTTLRKEAMGWDIKSHKGCHVYTYPKQRNEGLLADAATGFFLLDTSHCQEVFDSSIPSSKSFVDATLALGPITLTQESFFHFNYARNRVAAGSSYVQSLCKYLEKHLIYCEKFPTSLVDYRKENYHAGQIFQHSDVYQDGIKKRLLAAFKNLSPQLFLSELRSIYSEVHIRSFFNYSSTDPLEKNMFFSQKGTWMYVQSSKCGCTLIKNILARLENESLSTMDEMQIHSKDFHQLKMFSDFTLKEILTFLRSDDVYRFAFVRNPFRRIISCYINKFVHKKDNASIIAIKNYCIDRYSLSVDSFDFIHFLKFVSEQDPADMDRHWRPMVDALSYGKITYNFVGKLENFEDDFQKVLDSIGADDSNWKSFLGLRNASSYSKPWQEYYSEEAIDLVRQIYSRDFSAFDYSDDLKNA